MRKLKVANKLRLSGPAVLLLKCLLPIILSALIYTASYTSSLDTYNAALFYPTLASQMEHILMSLLLTVGGALLLDISAKENK